MAIFAFDKVLSLEELKGMIEKDLGPGYRFVLKKNRIKIIQDVVRGCDLIRLHEKQGKTIFKGPYGFMPSIGLSSAIILGTLVFLFLIAKPYGHHVIFILPVIIMVVILRAPSHVLVRKVKKVLEGLAMKT